LVLWVVVEAFFGEDVLAAADDGLLVCAEVRTHRSKRAHPALASFVTSTRKAIPHEMRDSFHGLGRGLHSCAASAAASKQS
jgi:hypothetical protein